MLVVRTAIHSHSHLQQNTIVSLILSVCTMFFTLHWANCVENLATPITTKICWFQFFPPLDAPIYSVRHSSAYTKEWNFRFQMDKKHSLEIILSTVFDGNLNIYNHTIITLNFESLQWSNHLNAPFPLETGQNFWNSIRYLMSLVH